ncbi:hypothetical protein LCGC14_0719090 [marine sediment metagenome]|uniref:Uncharacterized protein n=1 Tax=marine sediment metagenome TaxID=412755 RepID=A0A0F9QH77_9ZZZZ
MPDELIPDDDQIECWCGATGTYDKLFDASGLPPYPQGCGGSGMLICECGGDQCVCHHHGEVECPGCEDCDDPDEMFGW